MPVPDFDVRVVVAVINPDHLRVIWDDEVSGEGIGGNQLYMDIYGITWEQVEQVIAIESEMILNAGARACDIDDFDALLNELLDAGRPEEDGPEDEPDVFKWLFDLDAGVLSAVAALSAAECISTTSCRGHSSRGEPEPLVRFTTDEERLPLVRAAAAAAGCGLELDGWGMLQLHATNVLAFVEFAREMLKRREEFSRIEGRVDVERFEHEDLDGLDADVRRGQLRELLERIEPERIVQCDGQTALWGED